MMEEFPPVFVQWWRPCIESCDVTQWTSKSLNSVPS